MTFRGFLIFTGAGTEQRPIRGRPISYYDWDKLTAVGMFTGIDPEMLCLAHSKRVRVLD